MMPDVINQQLDIALSDIERAGVDDEVEVLGGGLFGIVDESAWLVCAQLPLAGEVVVDPPRLSVDRSCDGESSPPEDDPEPTAATDRETSEPREPTEQPITTEATEQEPTEQAAATAAQMEAKYLEHLGISFAELCTVEDDSYTHWSCFYDGVEDGPAYLQVNLTTDGGWSTNALEQMAATAGLHWFNFIGCDFPELQTIVVNINGLDYNVFRWDTMIDTALCN